MNTFLDFGPDTPEETMLKEQLRQLQQSYVKDAEPILNRLTAIHMQKAPRPIFIHDTKQERPI